jgi:hypothetical protein
MGDGLVVQARSLLRTEPFILVDVVCKSELEADVSVSMWGYNDGADDLDKNLLVSSLSFAGVPKHNRDLICAYWAQYFVAALIDMMRIAQGKIHPAGHWTFAWMIEDAVHEAVTDSLAYNQLLIMSRIAERAPALAIFNMVELGAKLVQHKRPDAAKRCLAQAIQQFAALHGCRAPETWDDTLCLERVRDRPSRAMAARIEGLIGSLLHTGSGRAIDLETDKAHQKKRNEIAAPTWNSSMRAFKL